MEDIVRDTVLRVLKTWAGMPIEIIPPKISQFEGSDPVLVSTTKYAGPFTGTFRVMVQRPFVNAVITQLLGADAKATEREALDVARELSNVLTGNLLTEMYGVDTAFELDPPHVVLTDAANAGKMLDNRTFFFQGAGNPLGFQFSIDA